MSTELEKKRIQLELIRVKTARAELEFRIMEREDEILRMREAIDIQVAKEKELETKI